MEYLHRLKVFPHRIFINYKKNINYKQKNWLILSEDVKVVKSKKRLRNGIKLKD